MTNGYQGKSFQTAARRRRGEPLEFLVEHWGLDEETGNIGPIDARLRIDPNVDTVRMGAAFGAFGKMLMGFSDEDVSSDDKLAQLDRELPKARKALRDLIIPPDRAMFDVVQDAVTVAILGELVQWVTQELSGLDPTKQASSSDGSAPTGSTSTDGAPPEA